MGVPEKPLWSMTAVELVRSYAAGSATPESVLASVLSRLEEVNGCLNAVVHCNAASAREAASASSGRWARRAPVSALDGVPLTVKDNLFVAGMPATWGSRLFVDTLPDSDDLPIAALRAAGAVFLGKTNTPELALSGHTDNLVFGATGNPRNPARSAGGSSGGAAAAVGSGIGPIGLATDAAGSIRRPAALAGLVGLKPGLGRVPRRHGFPLLAYDCQVIGPLARCVGDARTAFSIIAVGGHTARRIGQLRIAMFDPCSWQAAGFPVDEVVTRAFSAAVAVLRELGHDLVPIQPFWDPDDAAAIFAGLSAAGVARAVCHIPGWQDLVTPNILAVAEAGLRLGASDYVRLLDRLAAFRLAIAGRFEGFDALATPTSPAGDWSLTQSYPDRIGGQPAGPRTTGVFTTAISLSGLPAISLPAPVPDGAMPIGVQLIAPPSGEELLLCVAEDFERASPFPFVPICGAM